MKTEILNIDSKMRELGYSYEEGCETPIISNKENIFVVKDYIDNNKSLPCFKGVAFYRNSQIDFYEAKKQAEGQNNFYVLDFGNPVESDEKGVFDDIFPVSRFIFCSNEIIKGQDTQDKIIGNIKWDEQFENEKKIFTVTFTPTQTAVSTLGIKTEEIFSIIKCFKERFE